MKVKKLMAMTMATIMVVGSLVSCGGKEEAKEIYFLNFKPEIAEIYKEIAKDYEKETGVVVKVETAAAGTYEQRLKSEISKKDAPTIFQINGPVGYQSWQDYCLDIKDTELYGHLLDKDMAITNGDGVYGIPYAVEGYGIIYNDAIMQKYFALDGAKATSMEEINSYAKLKEVSEDMQSKKADLGIEGVYASTSMKAGEQWRWQTHLANLPLYGEFAANTTSGSVLETGLAAKTIKFSNNAEFKNVFDLYTNNSLTEKGLLSNKSVDDSMAEFALGKCAMVQNGNWAWGQISGVDGNVVKSEDIKFLPIYTGMEGEANQGICIGTENYLAINSQVSKEKQEESAKFINWLFSSETGKSYVTNQLGFIAPFDTFEESEKPADPLSKEVLRWMGDTEITSVPWLFPAFPSEAFKDDFGNGLLEYLQGSKKWDDVVDVVVDSWKAEVENKQ